MTPSKNIDLSVPALKLSDGLHVALDLMDEFKLMHLPVVDKLKYLGYVSETLILDSNVNTIGELVLAGEKTFTTDQESIYDTARKLSSYDITSIPVLSKDNKYLGVVTIQSIFKSLSEFAAVRSQGGVFSLIIKQHDYSLSEISRILEANGYKVLSLELRTVEEDPLKIEVVVKVNSLDLSTAYATLERHGYTIGLNFGENTRDEDNADRLDNLFKLLEL